MERKTYIFFTDHSTGEAMYRVAGEDSCHMLKEKDTEIIRRILEISATFYPEQYEALCGAYERSLYNKSYYDFLRARRIVNCCFGVDGKMDLGEGGEMNFSTVKCPLMAECKYYNTICHPTFDSSLSSRELEVMKLYFEHVPTDSIAERLFISIHTVNNHRKNALMKLNLHSIDEFIGYAYRNKMFEP